MENNKIESKNKFILKNGKEIIIDFLSVESLLEHKNDMMEISEQLQEWKELWGNQMLDFYKNT